MDLPVYELMISDDLQDDAEVNFVSLVDRPAIQKNWNAFNHKVKFNTDEEKRVISGAIMLANTPIFRSDVSHGDYYVVFSKETIFKIVQRYFKKGYQANVNIQHNQNEQLEDVYLFESFISDKERGVMPMQGFEDAPDGSWFGSMKVDNDYAWNEVKEGNIKGFSVEGVFEYSKAEKKEESIMAQIYQILKEIDFGGEGSGCSGDNCGRPKGSDDSNIQYGTNRNKNIDATIEYGKKNGFNIVKSDKINPNMIAMGSPSNQIIYINQKHKYWDNPIENQKKLFESGYLSSPNPLHPIYHESSHLKHKDVSQVWNSKEYQQNVAQKVSRYAKTNPSEFVAETYAGIKAGKNYDTDVMNLYKRFGGT